MRQRHLMLFASVASFVVLSCEDKSQEHPVFKYYPPTSVFEDGYVNKYYEHYEPTTNNRNSALKLTYSLYRKTSSTSFLVEGYTAGFDLSSRAHYHVEGTELYMDSLFTIRQDDTVYHRFKSSLHSRWDRVSPTQGQESTFDFYDNKHELSRQQLAVYDSLIDGKSAKVFLKSASRVVTNESDTTTYKWETTSYYVEGLGYFGGIEKSEEYNWRIELIEQMPLAAFRNLMEHGKSRIAYIDPEEVLDRDERFEICGHERFINDYYNSNPDGSYKHSKAALVDTVFNNLDGEKLMNQTGMLTFRFVVNCEGEAGRFIAEGYDLNYQPYEFPEETVTHLYEIIRKLTDWTPVISGGEPSDAYFYLTFKLNNGEITDILP